MMKWQKILKKRVGTRIRPNKGSVEEDTQLQGEDAGKLQDIVLGLAAAVERIRGQQRIVRKTGRRV